MLDYKAMRTVYCALVLPYISYCLEVWGNTYKSNTKLLYLLQRRALRIIYNANYGEHTNVLFINSGLLKFYELVELQTLLVMFKAKTRALPANIQTKFILIENEGRRKGHSKQPFARTTLKQMCT